MPLLKRLRKRAKRLFRPEDKITPQDELYRKIVADQLFANSSLDETVRIL